MKDILDTTKPTTTTIHIHHTHLITNTLSLTNIIQLIGLSFIKGSPPGIDSGDANFRIHLFIHNMLYYYFPVAGGLFSSWTVMRNYRKKQPAKSKLEQYVIYAPLLYLILFFVFLALFNIPSIILIHK